jgi:hypothetical protein
MHLLT